jgi:uncharacterized protein YbjQ (UPF0145 family)
MSTSTSKKIKMVTTGFYDTSKYETIGLVNALSVHSISLFRDIVGDITSMFGGKQNVIEKKYLEARNEVLHKLELEAEKLGADEIIGVECDISAFEQYYTIFASGTVIRKKRSNYIKTGGKSNSKSKNKNKNKK